MTLNMDDLTIKYKIGDGHSKTQKIASLSSKIGYRLAVSLNAYGDAIELL